MDPAVDMVDVSLLSNVDSAVDMVDVSLLSNVDSGVDMLDVPLLSNVDSGVGMVVAPELLLGPLPTLERLPEVVLAEKTHARTTYLST